MKKVWYVPNSKNMIRMRYIRTKFSDYLPNHKKADGELIFEEVYTNIAIHAYEKKNFYTPVLIKLEKKKEKYHIIFMDCGPPFDPTTYKSQPTDTTKVGGQGIRMIRNLSKNMKYRRIFCHNRLEIEL